MLLNEESSGIYWWFVVKSSWVTSDSNGKYGIWLNLAESTYYFSNGIIKCNYVK